MAASPTVTSPASTSPAAIPPAGLRRTAPPRIDAPRSDGSPGHAPAGPAAGPGLHILVAEDVALNAEMLQAMLEQRSEEHTSELQSLMRISYAVFCLKKKQIIITL